MSGKRLHAHLPAAKICERFAGSVPRGMTRKVNRSVRLFVSWFEPSCFMGRSCMRLSDRGHATRKLLSHRSLRHKSRESGGGGTGSGRGAREGKRARESERTKAPYVLTSALENFLLQMIYAVCLTGEMIALYITP